MKCQPSAPLHKRAFEQKEPKSLQYSGKPKVSYMCAKNTAKHSFSFMSEVSSNCLKSIVTEFINFQVNREWRRHSPFAVESRTVRVMRGAATPAFLLAFPVVVDEYRDREPVAHKCFIRQAAVFME